jgi:hypothetical protein
MTFRYPTGAGAFTWSGRPVARRLEPQPATLQHGPGCSCTVLAEACGVAPRTITFEYCLLGIRKRWKITCRHGEVVAEPEPTGVMPALGPLNAISGVVLGALRSR